MTDTLTSARSFTQVRRAAQECLTDAILHGHSEPSSTYWIEKRTNVTPRRLSFGRSGKDLPDTFRDYVVYQPNAVPTSACTWTVSPSEARCFDGLAAVLTSLQEPARNDWGSLFLISDEESSVPATSDMFLSHVKEVYSATWVHWGLEKWAAFAYQLAAKLLSADVETPQTVVDPENEDEWWLEIVAKCRGSVPSIMSAYDELVERFVDEVPANARDRIRFESLIDD